MTIKSTLLLFLHKTIIILYCLFFVAALMLSSAHFIQRQQQNQSEQSLSIAQLLMKQISGSLIPSITSYNDNDNDGNSIQSIQTILQYLVQQKWVIDASVYQLNGHLIATVNKNSLDPILQASAESEKMVTQYPNTKQLIEKIENQGHPLGFLRLTINSDAIIPVNNQSNNTIQIIWSLILLATAIGYALARIIRGGDVIVSSVAQTNTTAKESTPQVDSAIIDSPIDSLSPSVIHQRDQAVTGAAVNNLTQIAESLSVPTVNVQPKTKETEQILMADIIKNETTTTDTAAVENKPPIISVNHIDTDDGMDISASIHIHSNGALSGSNLTILINTGNEKNDDNRNKITTVHVQHVAQHSKKTETQKTESSLNENVTQPISEETALANAILSEQSKKSQPPVGSPQSIVEQFLQRPLNIKQFDD